VAYKACMHLLLGIAVSYIHEWFHSPLTLLCAILLKSCCWVKILRCSIGGVGDGGYVRRCERVN